MAPPRARPRQPGGRTRAWGHAPPWRLAVLLLALCASEVVHGLPISLRARSAGQAAASDIPDAFFLPRTHAPSRSRTTQSKVHVTTTTPDAMTSDSDGGAAAVTSLAPTPGGPGVSASSVLPGTAKSSTGMTLGTTARPQTAQAEATAATASHSSSASTEQSSASPSSSFSHATTRGMPGSSSAAQATTAIPRTLAGPKSTTVTASQGASPTVTTTATLGAAITATSTASAGTTFSSATVSTTATASSSVPQLLRSVLPPALAETAEYWAVLELVGLPSGLTAAQADLLLATIVAFTAENDGVVMDVVALSSSSTGVTSIAVIACRSPDSNTSVTIATVDTVHQALLTPAFEHAIARQRGFHSLTSVSLSAFTPFKDSVSVTAAPAAVSISIGSPYVAVAVCLIGLALFGFVVLMTWVVSQHRSAAYVLPTLANPITPAKSGMGARNVLVSPFPEVTQCAMRESAAALRPVGLYAPAPVARHPSPYEISTPHLTNLYEVHLRPQGFAPWVTPSEIDFSSPDQARMAHDISVDDRGSPTGLQPPTGPPSTST